VLIPHDFAEAMNVTDGSKVGLTLAGRQVVVKPVSGLVRSVAHLLAARRASRPRRRGR